MLGAAPACLELQAYGQPPCRGATGDKPQHVLMASPAARRRSPMGPVTAKIPLGATEICLK